LTKEIGKQLNNPQERATAFRQLFDFAALAQSLEKSCSASISLWKCQTQLHL